MRGKRLTVDEVKALPLRTKVVMIKVGKKWDYLKGQVKTYITRMRYGIHTAECSEGWVETRTSEELIKDGDDGYDVEYYEYTEGSTANEETI